MNNLSNYKAVLFDKDGTLFSFDAAWSVFCDRMLEHLAPGDETLKDKMAQTVGYQRASGSFIAGSLIVNASADEVNAAWSALAPGHDLAQVDALARAETKALPAVPLFDLTDVMGSLRQMGLKLGVATNDIEAGALSQLNAVNALALFDFVCGSDSGYGRKPGTGMVDAFCAQTGIKAEEVIFVGDSTHDIDCGVNAGVGLCVGVLTGPATAEQLAETDAVVLPSVASLPGYLNEANGAAA
ncbi:HAD family hydrolase [Candidatus Halocynthiibacter alkanivorans]|uniref:HAD family hydrolase n=1 Tax=Candidatus Halocynthiibacter alkanivorans TaxID=2267619 RepID=UPI000DF359FA|nr:HAD family hydrolase [Candidatus Halocynthiibacter alkanivorans]